MSVDTPKFALLGVTEVITGTVLGTDASTVRVSVLDVPFAVVTETWRAPSGAVGLTWRVAETKVPIAKGSVTVIPSGGVIMTVTSPLRFVPKIVRPVVFPWVTLVGDRDVIVGAF